MLSRIHIKSRNQLFIGLFVLLIFSSFALFARGGTTTVSEALSKGITCDENEWNNSIYFSGDSTNCPDVMEFVFKPAFVNEKNSELIMRFYTLPAGRYGSAMVNSGWVDIPYFVDVDSSDAKRINNIAGSTSQGLTLRIKMSKKNDLFYYPFDRYKGEIKAQSIDEISKEKIPGFAKASDSSLAGWKLNLYEEGKPSTNFSDKVFYESGLVTIKWNLSRASIVYLAVSILLILMIIALISAFAITRSISRMKRPPSMNLLLWLATVLFAILQVRFNFPGNPPIGILIDYLIVFPVLGLLLIFGIANTFFWLNRSDWDYENENPAQA